MLLVDPACTVSMRGVYAGFQIRNDGAQVMDDLWVRLDDFTDAGLPDIVSLGPEAGFGKEIRTYGAQGGRCKKTNHKKGPRIAVGDF